MEGRSGTTAAGTTADEKQEQDEAAVCVQRTGPNGRSGFRRELTCRRVLDRLGRSSNAYKAGDPFGGEESGVTVGFGSAEDQNHPDDDPMGESDFGVLKGVNWQIPAFDGKTTSWIRFEL